MGKKEPLLSASEQSNIDFFLPGSFSKKIKFPSHEKGFYVFSKIPSVINRSFPATSSKRQVCQKMFRSVDFQLHNVVRLCILFIIISFQLNDPGYLEHHFITRQPLTCSSVFVFAPFKMPCIEPFQKNFLVCCNA